MRPSEFLTLFGGSRVWTPAGPTGGGVYPHTWHYAGSPQLYTDVGKTTLARTDGDAVYVSSSQGSDTHDIVQAVAANRPTLRTGVLNGHPVFRCDGTDYLQGAFTGALTQPYTLFVVAQLSAAVIADGLNNYLLDGDDNAHNMLLFDRGGGPNKWAVNAGATLDGSATDANWNTWMVLINGALSQFWHNGVSEAAGDVGAEFGDGLTVGANTGGAGGWVGDIAEALIYDSNLSTADKNQVGQYLAAKYALSWTNL